VPGDDPSVVASGPTVADPTTFADARAVIAKYGISPPPAVAAHLAAATHETPKHLPDATIVMVASPQASLEAAAAHARAAGVTPILLGDAIEGEARDVGRAMAAQALATRERPTVLLSGGETTVTVVGKNGRGGRNGEFLAGLVLALNGAPNIFAFAGDTDGIDGSEDNAGAVVTPDTLARAKANRIDFAAALARNDMYPVYAALGDLVVTGPTLTNVNDFRAILIV
jgi:hydroxypyruvate reductase